MQQPVDLLAYYRDQLYERASAERRDPPFCRTALQLCHDLNGRNHGEMEALQAALFSALKQATWNRSGMGRLLGPVWLDYNMARSNLGPFHNWDQILHLAASAAQTAVRYRGELFGSHGCASDNQRRFKVALLFICMAIQRGEPRSFFVSLPRLPANAGPKA